jgi:hypothetical protein
MIEAMSDNHQPGVIGSLPSTRPHRRSGKRATPGSPADATAPASATPAAELESAATRTPAAKPESAATRTPAAKPEPAATRTPAAKPKPAAKAQRGTQPSGERERPRRPPSPARDPAPPAPAPTSPGALQTALEATAELTEIGLRAGARALRLALSRLPKP